MRLNRSRRPRRLSTSRYLHALGKLIDDQGYAVSVVPPDSEGLGWAYTVGLHRSGLPELILLGGLSVPEQHAALSDLAERAHLGRRFAPGEREAGVLLGFDVTFVEVIDTATQHFEMVNALQSGYHALQVVWPDHDHHFPWEDGYAVPLEYQPLLGVPPQPARSR